MKKIKLYEIGNEGDFNYYLFDKKQETAEEIAKIFIKTFNITWNFYTEHEDKKGKWTNKKIKVESLKDTHESIVLHNVRIDTFYGNKRMFIAIHCPQKDRLNFNRELFRIAVMPKPKKFKPLEK